MKSLFTNPFFDFLNTLCNFIVLNLIFLISCLPIITIGTALSSLYCVTLKEARGENGYLVRHYLKNFKHNLKQGICAFLVLFLAFAALLFGFFFWYSFDTLPSMIVTALIFVGAIAWFLIFTYTFPLIARFENSTLQTLKNAFLLALSNLKYTLALLLVDAFAFFTCLYFPPARLFMVFVGFAFIAYCHSFILKHIFEPFEIAIQS